MINVLLKVLIMEDIGMEMVKDATKIEKIQIIKKNDKKIKKINIPM